MRSDAATEAAFCLPPDGGSTSVDDDAAAGCARFDDAAGAASPTFSGEAGGVGSFADGLDLRSSARRGEPRFGELRGGAGGGERRAEAAAGRGRGGAGVEGGRRRTGRRSASPPT